MSFTPLSGGLSTALSGAIEPTKFISAPDTRSDPQAEELFARRIHEPSSSKTQTIKYTIIIVIISAIIFVTVIALYDIMRNSLNTYYANIALTDPNSHNDPEDIERTQIANINALWSSIIFAIICVIMAIMLVFILIRIL